MYIKNIPMLVTSLFPIFFLWPQPSVHFHAKLKHQRSSLIVHLLRLNKNCRISEAQLKKFRDCLIENIYRRCRDHWFPDAPEKGSGYRSLRFYEIKKSSCLSQACEAAKLKNCKKSRCLILICSRLSHSTTRLCRSYKTVISCKPNCKALIRKYVLEKRELQLTLVLACIKFDLH